MANILDLDKYREDKLMEKTLKDTFEAIHAPPGTDDKIEWFIPVGDTLVSIDKMRGVAHWIEE